MHTIVVTFALRDIDDAGFRELAAAAAPAFAAVPGLRQKIWLADAAAGTYGGVYLFARAEDAEGYLASDLFAGAVAGNPHLADVAVRRAAVMAVT